MCEESVCVERRDAHARKERSTPCHQASSRLVSPRKVAHPVHRMQRKRFASLQQSVGEAAEENAAWRGVLSVSAFENTRTSSLAQQIMAK
jgi:hypothetical protein